MINHDDLVEIVCASEGTRGYTGNYTEKSWSKLKAMSGGDEF